MPAWFKDSLPRQRETPEWEPEPLELPLEMPRRPLLDRRDETPPEAESRVIVIDLV
jgi:hypothetical protein